MKEITWIANLKKMSLTQGESHNSGGQFCNLWSWLVSWWVFYNIIYSRRHIWGSALGQVLSDIATEAQIPWCYFLPNLSTFIAFPKVLLKSLLQILWNKDTWLITKQDQPPKDTLWYTNEDQYLGSHYLWSTQDYSDNLGTFRMYIPIASFHLGTGASRLLIKEREHTSILC